MSNDHASLSPDPAPDLAIIGAGIAGGALATAAARRGCRVLLLEKSERHQDRVRGEFMPPRGVHEAMRLGVIDVFLAAGGHFVQRSVGYGEDIDPAAAEARATPLDQLIPGVAGALTFGHPQVCTALDEAAVAAGATLLRGVADLHLSCGIRPTLSFTHAGERRTVRPGLVVGADGRGSWVARTMGAQVQTDGNHHLLCGVLVDNVPGWPERQQTLGTEGDLAFYVFPQGNGRARLYACYSHEQRGRFSGEGNARRLLEAFRFAWVPPAEHLAGARIIGPCHGYPSGDTWIDRPGTRGVVLIGDAAGHNCPTIGQGVSIALRDARHVIDALAAHGGWSNEALDEYAQERRERMRRLRFLAQLFATLRCEFGPEARARRRRAHGRMAADPRLALPFAASQLGPFAIPSEHFTTDARASLLA